MLSMARQPVPRVAPEELRAELERGEPLVVLDVRGRSYQRSDRRISGALRIHPRSVEAELNRLPEGVPVVAYCT